jgi:hypothetical protein
VFFFSVAYEFRVPVFFEPVSVVKGPRIAAIIEYVSVMDWTAFFYRDALPEVLPFIKKICSDSDNLCYSK